MAIQSQVAKTEELKEDVAIINSVRFAELRVVDVVNFNIVSAHMLLKLLFFQVIQIYCCCCGLCHHVLF